MIKLPRIVMTTLLFTMLISIPAHAKVGDMGFFGGTSEGRKLPKTTDIILAETGTKKKTTTDTFIYTEPLVAGGKLAIFKGNLAIKDGNNITDTENSGTYTHSFKITPASTAEADAVLNRDIVFNVKWRREGQQIIKDYEVKTWTETMTTSGGEYTLDPKQSNFSISIIEDHTPGVVYAKGNISMKAVYTSGEGDDTTAASTVQSTGSIYSYDSAWSSTETHRIDTWIYQPTWQMQYQIRPSVSVNKTLQYSQNEPTAISFKGNYQEIIANKSSVSYDIFVKPNQFYDEDDSGSFNISSVNSFEQLIAPDTSFLLGHFAEADINRLFSMQVLTGEPSYFQPSQAMTRGQYVGALVKAIKLPIEVDTTKKTSKKSDAIKVVFPDVLPSREEYPYVMAAYKAGLAIGRDSGNFYIDSPIQRQEAIVILVRTLGLENLGLSPTPVTAFADDYQIASWAKKEIAAARTLGIISGDEDGNFRPLDNISKAEGAALVNRLINYMRYDLVTDYTDNIVPYAY